MPRNRSKGGRPPLRPEDRRDRVARVYLTPADVALIDEAAAHHDMTRSDFLRACALSAAMAVDRERLALEGILVAMHTGQTPADA